MDKDKARKTPEKLKIKLKRNKEKKGKKMRNDRITSWAELGLSPGRDSQTADAEIIIAFI